MELKYKSKFKRDLDISNKEVLDEILKVILNVKKATNLNQVHNLKKLKRYKTHYRIKVGSYRIGVIIKNNRIWFACFGHRSSIYKSFP